MKNYYLKKVLMNLSCIVFILTLFSSLAFSSVSEGQGIKSVSIALHKNITELSQLIEEIEGQTDYSFFYEDETLAGETYKIIMELTDGSVYDILSKVSNQTGLAFRQVNHIIAIKKAISVDPNENSNIVLPQTKKVSGKVTDKKGEPLPGATILLKGTINGGVTNLDGEYTLANIPEDGILIFSFIGFKTVEVSTKGESVINVTMEPTMESLDEVVVTALGIKREEKSLGYSVGKVSGEELNRVVNENVLNSMSGKIAGVTISQTGGTGSSVSMVIRGATSLSSDNQPLFVIDGVPMSNSVNNVAGFGENNSVDYGNAITDIDQDNIESVSVLKGPSAAALYGTRAGNGVVLITTKKAKENQKMKVTFSSNTVCDIPSRYLNMQKHFATGTFPYRPDDVGGGILPTISASDGIGAGPECDKGYWAIQWNAPTDANGNAIPTEVVSYPNNVKNFLNKSALTTTNGVTISGSNSMINYRLGISNMSNRGLIPNSDLNKNSISLSANSHVTKNFSVSTDINFSNNWADNRPATGYGGTNPLQWAYSHPLNIDIRDIKNYDDDGDDILRVSTNHENPYFLAYEVNNSFDRYRVYGNIAANWDITKHISLMGRISINKSDQVQETKIAPGYLDEPNNGAYGIAQSYSLERNMDFLATYKNDWNDFSLTTSVGGNSLYSKGQNISNSSDDGSGLIVPNVFTVGNIASASLIYSSYFSQRAIYSAYAMANLAWKEIAYLDLTARNDWSSTLPSSNRSYFYPSASLSLMMNKVFDLGKNINMLKIRGGIAQVGNDTDPYDLYNTYGNSGDWGDAIRLYKSGTLLSPTLKPEIATSYEIGTEIKAFSNRLRFDGTYYKVDNRNQIINVPLAVSSGYSSTNINAGLLQSKGVEIMLGFTPVRNRDWRWDVDINFSKNITRILELSDDVEYVDFWSDTNVKCIGYIKGKYEGDDGETIYRNGKVGNIYTRKVLRVTDENSEYYNYPILGSGLDTEWQHEDDYTCVGNYNPDFIMGMQTSLSYKNFTLNMTFDWRSGGKYVSQTYRYLSESVLTESWLNELVNPGDLAGTTSDELRAWVIERADKLIFSDDVHPVGGPTPEYGGFAETYSGYTVYDGSFAPGVIGDYDDAGNFVLEQENLGGAGTKMLPYAVSYPWELGQKNLFDADYIKLREISLSYNVPAKYTEKYGIQGLLVSVYSRNILLWTKDSDFGIDPERAFQTSGSGFKQGIERYNVYPWVVPVGFKLNVSF